MTDLTPVSTSTDFAVMSGVSIPFCSVTFQQWIEQLVAERFGTQTALAKAVGLQLTPFTRGVAAGTFSVVNLMKLAYVTDTPASEVLRRAGKGDVADLIEKLYGSGRDALTETQRQVIELWDRIDDKEGRDAVLVTLRIMATSGDSDRPDRAPRESSSGRVATSRKARAAQHTRHQ